MKKLTTTQKKNRRTSGQCIGGPWSGCRLTMPLHGDGKTAMIVVGNFTGHYKRGLSDLTFQWVNDRKRG